MTTEPLNLTSRPRNTSNTSPTSIRPEHSPNKTQYLGRYRLREQREVRVPDATHAAAAVDFMVQVSMIVDLLVHELLPSLLATIQQRVIVQVTGAGQHQDQSPVPPVVVAIHRVQWQRRLATETSERILLIV